MIQQRSGVILNTGSISGEAGIVTQGAYGPSKGAVHQMTRQMAVEYAPYGIRVNAIACGTVDTPIVHYSAAASGDPGKYWAMLRDNHPIGRIASADEVAAFFTYMASDLASFFTGSVIMMDGGYTARGRPRRTRNLELGLTGPLVAVTGGACGIGRATAGAFAAEGAAVALWDLDTNAAA